MTPPPDRPPAWTATDGMPMSYPPAAHPPENATVSSREFRRDRIVADLATARCRHDQPPCTRCVAAARSTVRVLPVPAVEVAAQALATQSLASTGVVQEQRAILVASVELIQKIMPHVRDFFFGEEP